MKLSKSFVLVLVIVLVFMISLIVFANDEDSAVNGNNKEKLIYLFQASPGERFDKITLDKIERIKISIQDIRDTKKSLSTLFDTDFQKTKLGGSENLSSLDYEYSIQPDNLKENENFLLISTGLGNKSFGLSNARRSNFTLTGFSLKGKNYEFTLGSASAFSWDTTGWTSEDSDYLSASHSATITNFTREERIIYVKLVSGPTSDRPREEKNE